MEPNNDHVICPKCVHQFRAIPVNVQEEITSLREQLSNMTAVVASVKRERDEKEVALKDAVALYQAFQDELAAMTKERDEALKQRWINNAECEFHIGDKVYYGNPGLEIQRLYKELESYEWVATNYRDGTSFYKHVPAETKLYMRKE